MNSVLKALNRRERVRILYHGKVKGEIVPAKEHLNLKTKNHPVFGMDKSGKETPDKIVALLRRGRYHDL
jgi:hypothetical protein